MGLGTLLVLDDLGVPIEEEQMARSATGARYFAIDEAGTPQPPPQPGICDCNDPEHQWGFGDAERQYVYFVSDFVDFGWYQAWHAEVIDDRVDSTGTYDEASGSIVMSGTIGLDELRLEAPAP